MLKVPGKYYLIQFSLIDGIARIFFLLLDAIDHHLNMLGTIWTPSNLVPRRQKNIWKELGLNPGHRATQATAKAHRAQSYYLRTLWMTPNQKVTGRTTLSKM